MKTRCSRRVASAFTTASVNVSQPCPWWLPAWPASTVSVAFRRRTPWSAQAERSPFRVRNGVLYSSSSYLYMLKSEGGTVTPGWTEKQSPWACLGPW